MLNNNFHKFIRISGATLVLFFSWISVVFSNPVTIVSENPTSIDTLDNNVQLMFPINHGKLNSFDIKNNPKFKHESFKFYTAMELPDGFLLSIDGMISWSPSAKQFGAIKEQALFLDFYAHSTSNNYIIGKIRVFGVGDFYVDEAYLEEDSISDAVAIVDPEIQTEEPERVPLSIVLPTSRNWDNKKEGQPFSFKIDAIGGSEEYKFELLEPEQFMENLDQFGNFNWTPDYDITSREELSKSILLNVKAFDTEGNETYLSIPIYVDHVNRPPVVNEFPTFYIQYNSKNTYQLNEDGLAYDLDGDSIIFHPVLKDLQQGMTLNKQGEIFWKPSKRQFNALSKKPIIISFRVVDYPSGASSAGQLRIDVSQTDEPPSILMTPKEDKFTIGENEELQLSFFITDPNGEEDLLSFDFVSENREIKDEALYKKSNLQYEFSWLPSYDFIKEQGGKKDFTINFFAIDKESNRTEKSIQVTVEDVENLLEKDRILYDQYRTVLERSWDMIVQLNKKESEFDKAYKKAKKGKKGRSVITASLGGLTGMAAIIDNADAKKWMTGMGGTATATLGTLEASNVIGESPGDIMQKLNYVSQKRNDLVVYGNVFASKYALPLSRRANSFQNDMSNLSIHLNLKDIAKLELDSSWENKKKSTDKNIKKEFKDFNPDPRFEKAYKKLADQN